MNSRIFLPRDLSEVMAPSGRGGRVVSGFFGCIMNKMPWGARVDVSG
jgi:hypothetical protein